MNILHQSNTHISSGLKGTLTRDMAHPGKAPTSAPPEVLCPRGTQGFGNLPKDRPSLGETTNTTSESCLCTNRVLLPNTQVGRVSLLTQEVLPPHSGLCQYIGWPVETGSTIHYNANQFLYTFLDIQITLSTALKLYYVHFRTSIPNI